MQTIDCSGAATITGALTLGSTLGLTGALSTAAQITSTIITGTAPFVIASTTKVANLNADLLDGGDWAAPGSIGSTTPAAGAFTTISASGAITSTLATGTAPFTVASTTKVSNLNADQLDSGDWTAPGAAIGSGTRVPGTSQFTTVDVSGATSTATASVSSADGLTVANAKVATTWTVPFYLFGTMVDTHMWIAPRACKVVSAKEIHSVVGGASCAVRPRKITDTSAPGAVASGTVKEITQAAFDGTATVNTTQTGTLSATASDYTFASGDKLALDASGTMTGLVGILVVEFQAV